MKLGPAAVIVVVLGAPVSFGLSLGCSHEARPPVQPVVQPDERPPLPPASGTPIGHLVDDASELKLSDDQLSKLQAINDDLAGRLAADDSELRPDPVPESPREAKPRGLGFRAGGVGADGAGGRTGAFPGGSSGGNAGASSGGNAGNGASSEQIIIPAATVGHVYQQRAHHVRDAIRSALGLLDSGQQVIARRVLTEHGVDLDTGEVRGGDPGAAQLEDPKLGQPLPRER
jgi:hypothetical protein